MARFKTNPWELDQLLSILDSCKLVLPEFQRSFVWRATDIDLLLTSLVQDFPAGSLLFLRAGAAEQELAWRRPTCCKRWRCSGPGYANAATPFS